MENHPEDATETVEPTPEAPSEAPTAEDGTHSDKKGAKTPRNKDKKTAVPTEAESDPVSKKMFLYSKIFALLAVICIGFLTTLYLKKRAANKPHLAEVASVAPTLFKYEMEQVQAVLHNQQDLRVELAFECSKKEACEFLKDHPEQAKDILIPLLAEVDPESISSSDSKKVLRQKIADELNTLDLDGKIVEVNFNNLSIEGESK